MIDFSVTECSKEMYIYCFVFYLFMFLAYRKRYGNISDKGKLDYIFWGGIFVYVITSFYNGDFWHLQDYISYGNDYWKPSEPIYDIISEIVGNNYLLFRIIVWGSGLVLLYKIFRCYELNINTTFYYFFVLYISVFDYARVSLAMAVYFLGIALLTKEHPSNVKKYSVKVLSIILILLSSCFHTSMLAIIALTFILWIPLNRRIIVGLCIFFPVFSYVIKFVVFDYILADGINDLIFDKVLGLVNAEMEDNTSLEKIRLIWHYSTFYIPFILITKYIYFNKNAIKVSLTIQQLYKITLAIMILATSILFLGISSKVLFYRYLYMSMIPLTILVCKLKELNIISKKVYNRLILLGALYIAFRHSKVLLRWNGPLS